MLLFFVLSSTFWREVKYNTRKIQIELHQTVLGYRIFVFATNRLFQSSYNHHGQTEKRIIFLFVCKM